MAARGYLLEGDLYMAPFVAGAAGSLIGPFEGATFSMQPNGSSIDLISKGRLTSGELVESVSERQPTDFNVTFNEANPQILAIGLMGSVSALTQASGTFAAAPLNGTATVTVKVGAWVALPRSNLAATPMTFKEGTTLLVEGTDFELNRHLGMIRALDGGALIDNDVVILENGAFGANNASRILGGLAADVRVKFILDGRNRVDRGNVKVTVHEAVLRSDEVMDFLSGGYLTTSLSGRMKKPANQPSAFEVEVQAV
jgi:hypothetical protein